jgi:hypothetical protein
LAPLYGLSDGRLSGGWEDRVAVVTAIAMNMTRNQTAKP